MLRRLLFASYYAASGRGHVLRERDLLDKLYRGPRDLIEAHSRSALARLLSKSAQHVPYYRELLGTRTITADHAPDRLAQMPVLTKTLIRQNAQALTSGSRPKTVRWNHSGGSTGEPIRLLQDLEMSRAARSFALLLMRWAGHQLGEPHVLIWGVPRETVDQKVPRHEHLFRLVHNQTYLNCYRVSDALLDQWVGKINALRPTLIEAYVDAIYELAKRALTTGQRLHAPRGVITSAGVLTPSIRDTIARAFQCPVLNRYGSREVSNVACSCGMSDSLHVHEATHWVEVVDEEGRPCPPGREGHILITLLTNSTMPLIRYRIEDRGVLDEGVECKCGRQTKKLARIAGRQNDYLVGRQGIRINGVALTTLLYPVQGIKQYQYRQSAVDNVELAVVALPGAAPATLEGELSEIARRLERMLNGTPVHVRFEPEILPSSSGKYRYVVNQLAKTESAAITSLSAAAPILG